jgi:outer membrane protein OmpA-like peptidoglycan-associated protein
MINKQRIAAVFTLLLISLAAVAQTRDSSSAEIQKQALEMREKLNRYMADKLLTGEKRQDTGVQVFFDSISTQLYKQQSEIEELKQRFARLEEMIQNGEIGGNSKKQKNGTSVPAVPASEQVSERQLNLYFAFDEYKLSAEQVQALKAFLKDKKIKRVRVSGYTDWRGTEQHNTKLANNRSQSVVKILNQLIIHYQVLEKGECVTANEHTPEKAQWCRRVEVVIR